MFHVTLQARSELYDVLSEALLQRATLEEDDLGLRLVPGAASGEARPVRFGLVLDTPRPDDEVIEHDGCSVLIVNPPTLELLEDVTLDVIETPKGVRRLGFRDA